MSGRHVSETPPRTEGGKTIGPATLLAILTGGPRPRVRAADPDEEAYLRQQDQVKAKQRVLAFGANPSAARERRIDEEMLRAVQ